MPERRRQRQQRVRHDAGGGQSSVGASNREPEADKAPARPARPAGSGVVYAEPKEYESVKIMPDKEVVEPQKYHRPGVLSNWSRYEELATDEIEEGEDYLLGEDFSSVLEQQASSMGGYLQLKGESSWEEDETNILNQHGLGVLRVADLVAAINTLPLYTQLNMPEESLPESILEFYTHLAEDNKKLYQPSTNYTDTLDVNQKILESLKISDTEPLDLSSEEPETSQSTKNAVDVALSLSEAFPSDPEDVDLDTFMQQPIGERQASPEKQPNPVRQASPEKQPNPVRQASPEKQPSPVRQASPEKQPSPVRQPSPVKEVTPPRHPKKESSPVKPVSVPSTINHPNTEETTSKGTSTSKEPETRPTVSLGAQKAQKREKSKEKSPESFDFGLPKKDVKTNDKLKESGQNLPKVKVPSNTLDVSEILNIQDSAAQKEEMLPAGPTVDLDAQEEQTKPVLLVSKTEAEDLEDWLDSMLDD